MLPDQHTLTLAAWLAVGIMVGGALLGWALFLAQTWVVKRWGGRLGEYLCLKGRHLSEQRLALLAYDRQLLAERQMAPDRMAERAEQCQCGRNGADCNPEAIHNVIPSRRLH